MCLDFLQLLARAFNTPYGWAVKFQCSGPCRLGDREVRFFARIGLHLAPRRITFNIQCKGDFSAVLLTSLFLFWYALVVYAPQSMWAMRRSCVRDFLPPSSPVPARFFGAATLGPKLDSPLTTSCARSYFLSICLCTYLAQSVHLRQTVNNVRVAWGYS